MIYICFHLYNITDSMIAHGLFTNIQAIQKSDHASLKQRFTPILFTLGKQR